MFQEKVEEVPSKEDPSNVYNFDDNEVAVTKDRRSLLMPLKLVSVMFAPIFLSVGFYFLVSRSLVW
jgi:hypothetical protein